ncbi:MAG: PD-(D/E)XK nuclease family protein [Nanoarchaeota archaeon]
MKLSISKVNQYYNCAYSFYLSYIRKEPIEKTPQQLIEGNEKHKIFENVIDDAKKLSLVLNISKSAAIERAIGRNENFSKYKNDCDNFVVLSKNIEQQGGNPFPEHREIKLYDKELNIAGVIDRVDIEGDSVLLIDYKTGKEHQIDNYYFQLAVYVYMYEKEFKKNVSHWGIFFSKTGAMLKEEVKREEIDIAIDKIKLARLQIDESIKNKDFPKNPSPLCKWCSFYQNKKCDGKNTPPMIPVI